MILSVRASVLEERDLLLRFAEAKEQGCEIRRGAFIHQIPSSSKCARNSSRTHPTQAAASQIPSVMKTGATTYNPPV